MSTTEWPRESKRALEEYAELLKLVPRKRKS